MFKTIGAAFALMLMLAPAIGRDLYPPMLTAEKLLQLCNGRDKAQRFSCGYYVMGAIDTQINNEALLGTGQDGKFALCPPAGKTPEEFVTVVRHAIENRPDDRTKPAISLIWDAMRAAFPCS